jgi:hypothetical protein
MSTRTLKHLQLYEQLSEAIDFENAVALPLRVNVPTRTTIGGLDLGMQIERFPKTYKPYFRPGTTLYNNFNNNYYNVGFDIDESTIQVQKTDYKALASVLGVVVKSTLRWIKENNPDVLTVMPTAGTPREFNKKLSIYAAILEKNQALLDNLGYTWDYYKFNSGKGVYIAKKELLK